MGSVDSGSLPTQLVSGITFSEGSVMAAFVSVLAAGFLAASALPGQTEASALTKESGVRRQVVEVQWPGWQAVPGYGQELEGRREHCWRLRERLRGIHYRMQFAPPWERDRMGTRIYEIRERLRQGSVGPRGDAE